MNSARGMKSGKLALVISIFLTLVIVLTSPVQSAVPHTRTIARTTNTVNGFRTCLNDGICGWEVYNRETRDTEFHVPSSCRCSTQDTCVRASDELSSSSYIYRCRTRRIRNSQQGSTTGPSSTASAASS